MKKKAETKKKKGTTTQAIKALTDRCQFLLEAVRGHDAALIRLSQDLCALTYEVQLLRKKKVKR